MKKTVIAIASLLVICIVLIGSLFIYKTSMVQNVFDEMYYAESQGILKPTRTSFYTVQAIENQSYTSIYQQEGVSTFTVDSAQLLAGETFEVLVYSAEGEVCFLYAVSTSNGSLYFTMGYSIKTKELGISSVLLEEYTANSGEYFVDTTEKAI
ncbi:MAG: TipC family immunity protein, partial [Oscillospiraceae bacterium]